MLSGGLNNQTKRYAFAGPIVTESEIELAPTFISPRNEFNEIKMTEETLSLIQESIDELEKDFELDVFKIVKSGLLCG